MRRLLLPLVVCVSLVAACGGDGGDDEPPASVSTLTVDDADTMTELTVGEGVTVSLPQCIACGYTWQVVEEPDEDVLELFSEGDIDVEQEDGATGGTTEHEKLFEAVGEGSTTVVLGYVGPGEGDEPEDLVAYTFEVS